ncbi:hypothetical protein Y032_0009g624 [Ancylostoma ceylanicum]|uniref:Reverse transcriptase domain-containing protein n=1 Tax=Ancylostoma ceylanicum TaxID=53326 RepID=A0A016VKI6_9BILA|nr:hypothetical protein Y032_0009g624 [Ancylostoma ceylanicum]
MTLDAGTKHLLEGPPFTLLYADDGALIADSKAGLQLKIQKWQSALADAGLKLNLRKTGLRFMNEKLGKTRLTFLSFPHIANNLFVVVTTCLLYVQYCRILLHVSKGSTRLSFAQKSFFVQCTCICMINFACAMIYVYMEFFPPPACFVYLGHITWQLGNGEQRKMLHFCFNVKE